MDAKKFFEEANRIMNNMSGEEFLNLIDSCIESCGNSLPDENKAIKTDELEFELRADISRALKMFTDDYASRIEGELMNDIVSDVIECSDFENGFWSGGDIALAIGRVLCERLGIE